MKKITALFFALTLINVGNSQVTFNWGKKFGGIGNDRANTITTDPLSNPISAGVFASTVDFDPGPGVFTMSCITSDAYVQKLDVNGNFQWAKQFQGLNSSSTSDAASIVTDINSNLFITGACTGTVDFDPAVPIYSLAGVAAGSAFLCKLNASGNFQWAHIFPGTGSSGGMAATTDTQSNVYFTGFYNGVVDFDPSPSTFTLSSTGSNDIFLCKFDQNGNFLWAKSFGGASADVPQSIAIDSFSNLYVGGAFYLTSDFDPGPAVFNLSSNGAADAFIFKIDGSGNFIWAKSWGAANNDQVRSLCYDQFSSSIYTACYFTFVTDLDPGPSVSNFTVFGGADIAISKFDLSGNFIYAKQIGGTGINEIPRCITTDNSGNIYFTSDLDQTVDYDPGPGIYTLTSIGQSDAVVAILNSGGNFVWAGQTGGAQTDVAEEIVVSNSGNLYLAGLFNSSPCDLDPLISGTLTANTSGSFDSMVLKLAPCSANPSSPSVINGAISFCNGVGIQNYSIATVVGANSYSWTLPGGWSGSSTTNTIAATPGSSGIMSVTAINACGSSSAQTLSVTVNPNPTISVNSGAICNGSSFTINPSGASSYTIQGGNAVVSPTSTTSYTVVGTSSAGCVSNTFATSNITVNPLPTVSANTSTNQLCVGSSATLTGSGASTYTWNPGGSGSSIVISPTVNTTYTVTGTDVNGCQNTSVITQSVINCSGGVGIVANSVNSGFFNIYPNPVKEKLIIQADRKLESIEVYNSIGEIILTISNNSSSIEIDLSERSKGIYFVRIGSYTTKIIKE